MHVCDQPFLLFKVKKLFGSLNFPKLLLLSSLVYFIIFCASLNAKNDEGNSWNFPVLLIVRSLYFRGRTWYFSVVFFNDSRHAKYRTKIGTQVSRLYIIKPRIFQFPKVVSFSQSNVKLIWNLIVKTLEITLVEAGGSLRSLLCIFTIWSTKTLQLD